MEQGFDYTGILKDLMKQLQAEFGIRLAYLFGSRATGEGFPASDYDVALLLADPRAEKLYEIRHRICAALNTDRVDVISLTSAPPALKYNVIARGRRLYAASRAERVEFEAGALCMYYDYLPILRQLKSELLGAHDDEAGIQRYRAALGKTEELLAQIGTSEK